MKKLNKALALAVATALFLFPAAAMAEGNESGKIDEATQVLIEIMRIPEKSVPPSLLLHAYAVAVIPRVIKAG